MHARSVNNKFIMAYSNSYTVSWFDILTYRNGKYVVYGEGHWIGHVMDWRGGNFFHGRLPNSPVFDTEADARAWLRQRVLAGDLNEGDEFTGHHSGGDYGCSKNCDDRHVATVHFAELMK